MNVLRNTYGVHVLQKTYPITIHIAKIVKKSVQTCHKTMIRVTKKIIKRNSPSTHKFIAHDIKILECLIDFVILNSKSTIRQL